MGYNLNGQLGDGFIDGSTPYGPAAPEEIFPLPQPVLTSVLTSNTNLQIEATLAFGGNFHLLAITNLAQPLNQWKPVWTNSISTRGTNNFSVTLTNPTSSGGVQFYILQSQ
jgi:hypothetical protein